jgi:uncharacterized protein YjbI with pentapeptide repeats
MSNATIELNTICINMNLINCNLRQSCFNKVSFEGAKIIRTDFRESIIKNVNFKSANFAKSALQNASIENVEFDRNTRLPDLSYYDPDQGLEQLDRFIKPTHPEFWEPDWV